MVHSLVEAKKRIDDIISWCNNNDAYDDADALKIYLHILRSLATRATEHILDLDYDYVKGNFDDWDEYLMEELGISYDDFKTLTENELPNIF